MARSDKIRAKNKKELAQMIPCGRDTLDRLFSYRYPDQPERDSSGYDVELWRRFYAAHRAAANARVVGSNGASPYPMNARELSIIEKNKVSAAAAQFDLEVKQGEFVRRIDVNKDIDVANATLRREMLKLVTHILPAKCQGLSAAEMAKIGLDELNRVITLLPGHMIRAIRENGNGS